MGECLLQAALKLWKSTSDVFTWLVKEYMQDADPYIVTQYVFNEEYQLEWGMATKICMSTIENDIALLTIDVAQPTVLEVVKDTRVTFPDMLGTIGVYTNI